MSDNIAFSALADKRFGGVISNDIILKLNPLWPCSSIFSQHVIQYIDQFIRVNFSEPIFVVLQCLHMYP